MIGKKQCGNTIKQILSSGKIPGTVSSRTELLVFVRRPSTQMGLSTGAQFSWLERLSYTQEVAGSSPAAPTIYYICAMKLNKRDYKKEYKKYGKGGKAKKYRAFLNKINRRKGTYGNGDGLDEAHVGSSDKTKPQPESKNRANNRPKRRRSR